jgi:hypothetical protein
MAIIVDLNKTLVKDGFPIQRTIDYVNSSIERVYIVSGSHVSKRYDIERMLSYIGVKYDGLYLNPRDYGDNDFKESVAKALKPTISLAIDNSEKARARYESLGIKTIHPKNLIDINNFWN